MNGEFFDEQFFCLPRGRGLSLAGPVNGLACVYTPESVAWHVRRVPRSVAASFHRNQLAFVKNRFLMRAKNISFRLRQVFPTGYFP